MLITRRVVSPLAVRACDPERAFSSMGHTRAEGAHQTRWNAAAGIERKSQQEHLKPLIGSGLTDLPTVDYGIAAISPCYATVLNLERSAASVRFFRRPTARIVFVHRYSRGYTLHGALTLVLSKG
jgi:hypothetical protein